MRSLSHPSLTVLALAIGAWVVLIVAYMVGVAVVLSAAGTVTRVSGGF